MGSYEEFPALALINTLESLKKGITGARKMNRAGDPQTPRDQWMR